MALLSLRGSRQRQEVSLRIPKEPSTRRKAEDVLVCQAFAPFSAITFHPQFPKVCVFKMQCCITWNSIILRQKYHCKNKAVTHQRNALAGIQIHLNWARHRHRRPSQANPPVEHRHSFPLQTDITEFESTSTGSGTFIYAVFHCTCKMLRYVHSFTYNNTTNF